MLIERHQQAVFGLAYRLCRGSVEDAADLAQDTFVRALRGIASFRGDSSFATWLHRIAVNLFLNRQESLETRRRRTQASLCTSGPDCEDGAVIDVADPAMDPAERAANEEEGARALKALDELSTERRIVVVLCDLEGRSYEEIAQMLGIPVGTVRSRLFRAREDLRQKLGGGSMGVDEEVRAREGKGLKA